MRGVTVRVGTSTGRSVTDTCELIYDTGTVRDCHPNLPFQTTLSTLASYVLPKVQVQLSGVFRSSPGTQISANRVYTNAEIQPSLGRPLPGGAQNVTINLLSPGDMYRDRINLMDLRFAKVVRFGGEAAERGRRHLQRVQFQRGPELQQHVWIGVAHADGGAAGARGPDKREVRLLVRWLWAGSGWAPPAAMQASGSRLRLRTIPNHPNPKSRFR